MLRQTKNLAAESLAKFPKSGKLQKQEKIHKKYQQFHKKNKKCVRFGKYKPINDILYDWHKKCCFSDLYSNNPLLKKLAKKTKKQF